MRVVTDVTCLACGCVCDDLVVTVADRQVVEARNACPRGRAWLEPLPAPSRPVATIAGRLAEPEAAIEETSRLLAAARRPLIFGLNGSTLEAQAAAVALADRVGSTIDATTSPAHAAALAAFQRIGRVGATLGEVRNRADVVVFWRVDPVTTHPRHLERYSVDPVGEFLPGGRADRTVLVAGSPTPTWDRADDALLFDEECEIDTLYRLRARLRGLRDDPGERSAGQAPSDRLATWADRLAAARYGALFYDPSGDVARHEALFRLVRDLNARTRFVVLPMGGPGNPTGVEAVLAWQTGFAAAVDLSRGFPRYLPGEATAEARLAAGGVDLAIVIGEFPALSTAAIATLARVPVVRIGPGATSSLPQAAIGFDAARTGVETAGTVMRCDGVTLPLRPLWVSDRPTERDWIDRLRARLERRPGDT